MRNFQKNSVRVEPKFKSFARQFDVRSPPPPAVDRSVKTELIEVLRKLWKSQRPNERCTNADESLQITLYPCIDVSFIIFFFFRLTDDIRQHTENQYVLSTYWRLTLRAMRHKGRNDAGIKLLVELSCPYSRPDNFAENGMLSLTALWITSCVTRSLKISEKLKNLKIVYLPPPPQKKNAILTNLHNIMHSPLGFGSTLNRTNIKNFTPLHKTKTNLEIYLCKHFKIIYVNKLPSRRVIPFDSTL